MKKYILLLIGGKNYRIEIDEELDKKLRLTLKDKYQFDVNNCLITNQKESSLADKYYFYQKIFKCLLDVTNNKNLTGAQQEQIKFLENYINLKKSTVYFSDFKNLESLIASAINIYNSVRYNSDKIDNKGYEVKTSNSVAKDHTIQEKNSSFETKKENTNGDFTDSVEDLEVDAKLNNPKQGLKEEINDIIDQTLNGNEYIEIINSDEVVKVLEKLDDIDVVICSNNQEYTNLTHKDANDFNVEACVNEVIRSSEDDKKLILPPDTDFTLVAQQVFKTLNDNKDISAVIASYAERTEKFNHDMYASLVDYGSKMRTSFGAEERNLNAFGDELLNRYIAICDATGQDYEKMFKDYFQSYSKSKRSSTVLDKFLRQYIRKNGGDESIRYKLETILVKKAIRRGILKRRYNRYLQDGYRDLDITADGRIRFENLAINNMPNFGGDNPSNLTGSLNTGMQIKSQEQINKQVKSTNELNQDTSNPNGVNDGLDINYVLTSPQTKSQAVLGSSKNIYGNQIQNKFKMNAKNNKPIGGIVAAGGSIGAGGIQKKNSSNPFIANADEFDDENEAVNDNHLREKGNTNSIGSDFAYGNGLDTNDDNANLDEYENHVGENAVGTGANNPLGNLANTGKNLAKEGIKKGIKGFLAKYKLVFIGVIAFAFVLLLLVLAGGAAQASNDSVAYSGCTDEFWWPIGVNEPNESGVYIDEPSNYTYISSYFGYREAPTAGASTYHEGIDIPAPEGTPIVAALDGTVTIIYDASDGNTCGNGVVLSHANGMETLYCHASKIDVSLGDNVAQGTIIAEVGTTGASTGNHLHFSIIIDGEKVDPLNYVSTDALRPTCSVSIVDGMLSLTTPSLSRSDFILKMENYCTSSGNSNFCTNFSDEAGNIYDWSIAYGINPELVVVTAGREQGWKKCASNNYNFWGLKIPNGSGCDAHVIPSLEQGIKELADLYDDYSDGYYADKIMERYNERVEAGCDEGGYGLPGTFLGMLSIYSWIGDYRANPGSAGSGGCYYLKIIYGEDYSLCSSSNTCASVHGGEGCSRTTVCEQSDYTKYGSQVTLNIWNNIFGG